MARLLEPSDFLAMAQNRYADELKVLRRQSPLFRCFDCKRWIPREELPLRCSECSGPSLRGKKIGYRRKLSDAWSLNVTVRDVFDDFGSTTTLSTPTFTDQADQVFGGRAAFIGLTWNFGGGQRRPEQFDFSAPTTGS